eukprot:3302951-Amphidinium_carterae.1
MQGGGEARRSCTTGGDTPKACPLLIIQTLGEHRAPTHLRDGSGDPFSAAASSGKQAAPESKELPLQDRRAKLKAQVRKLISTLDKQQELLAAQQLKVQQLRRELATTHIELAKLPEEVLPAPKKIPMELLKPSLVGLMKYVQSQAKGGDLTASTLLEECVASLELSKDKANPPPALLPLESGDSQGDADEDMVGDEEPSAKKPRGMGSGTPPLPAAPTELPSQAAASTGTPPPADGSAGEAASSSSPTPAAAEAAAVSEEDIQAVLAQ